VHVWANGTWPSFYLESVVGNRIFLRALIVFGLICAVTTTVNAAEMYFTPAVVYTDDDPHRGADDGVAGGQLSYGWVLSDRWSLEAMAGHSNLNGGQDLRITEGSLNILFSFSPYSNFSPYLIGGVGMMHTDSDLQDPESSTLGNLGAGLKIRFGDSPVSLRLEYRERFETANTDSNHDSIASLGLQFAFGGQEPPPPAPIVQQDGDADGDGVADSRDACPNTPAGQRVDARGCLLDGDGDGVTDNNDQCPDTFRGAAVDARGCELDDDRDGIVNRLDNCPNTTAGVPVDIKGCEIREIIELPGVNFESNSDRLIPGTESVLHEAAATLRRNPDLVVEVAGHTDSVGSDTNNASLSERRAITVRDFLLNLGVSSTNLTARGYGEGQPVASNETPEGRAQNRRVELRVQNR